jgi:hypothetical protein
VIIKPEGAQFFMHKGRGGKSIQTNIKIGLNTKRAKHDLEKKRSTIAELVLEIAV